MQVNHKLLSLPAVTLRDRETYQRRLRSPVPQCVLLMGLLTDPAQLITLPGIHRRLSYGPG